MNKAPLPSRPNIELYKKLAKDIVKVWKSNAPGIVLWEGREVSFARTEIAARHPRFSKLLEVDLKEVKFSLADAQFLIAREYGFESWPKFAVHIASLRAEDDPYRAFLIAATVPLDGTSHVLGDLADANAILAQDPEVGTKDIFTAASTGNIGLVRQCLARNPKLAKRKGGPHGWDALCYLCFSKYLRLDNEKSDDFVACAGALLEAGANANSGWYDRTHSPDPEWESALYGATGVAQHPGVTQVLLDFGADPNDNETPYHAPETYDNRAVSVLIASGKLSAKSLSMMLVRKSDFHDLAGVRMLLEAGADPNLMTMWKVTGLHHAIRRDNSIAILDLLLDHGADPKIANQLNGLNGAAMAARRGRGDFLSSLVARGITLDLNPIDALVAACAMDDRDSILVASDETKRRVRALGGALMAEFAGTGNAVGVGNLLDLGLAVDGIYMGDGYFAIAPGSTPLHVAAWKAHSSVVDLLVARGAKVNARDGAGKTPLMLAVKACVDSYWMNRRTPDSVRLLLEAGATKDGIVVPCGYDEVDTLLSGLD